MSYEYGIPDCCCKCKYFSKERGPWPDECEFEGRSLECHDNENARPSWCPLIPED